MTKDDIIRLAQEAGMSAPTEVAYNNFWTADQVDLERFFHMAQAAEREACAKIFDTAKDQPFYGRHVASKIRARGEK